MLPKISESETFQSLLNINKPINVTAEWFNKFISPLGILILFLIILGSFSNWKITNLKNFTKKILPPFIIASIFFFIFIIFLFYTERLNIHETNIDFFYGTISLFLSFLIIFSVFTEILRDTQNLAKNKGEGILRNILPLILKNRPRYVGYLVHFAVALLFIGFSGGAFKKEIKNIILLPGQKVSIDKYELIYLNSEEKMDFENGFASLSTAILLQNKLEKKNEPSNTHIKKYLEETGFKNYKIKWHNPFHTLLFSDEIEFLKFSFLSLKKTLLLKIFEILEFDDREWKIYLSPSDKNLIAFLPWIFHKYVQQLKRYFKNIPEEIVTIKSMPGHFIFYFEFYNSHLYSIVKNIIDNKTPLPPLKFFSLEKEKKKINIIEEREELVLKPEVRYYFKHENPTSEVSIRRGFFEDLYVITAPSKGREEIILTAMINPFFIYLWLGTGLIFIFTLFLILERPKKK